jgi:hypothetical protein
MRDGVLTCRESVDPGFAGAPTFVALTPPDSSDPDALLVKCVGLLLPGDTTTIATFDRIRLPLRRIVTDELTPGVSPSA